MCNTLAKPAASKCSNLQTYHDIIEALHQSKENLLAHGQDKSGGRIDQERS